MPEVDTATQLAIERTRLAADRTQMAWIRTAFSMISFGFSVFKFFEYLRLTGMMPAGTGHSPRNFGLLLIVIGTLALVAATWQHRTELGKLARLDSSRPGLPLSDVVAVLVIVLGVIALVNVTMSMGPL